MMIAWCRRGIYLAVVEIRSDRETERRFNSVSVVY